MSHTLSDQELIRREALQKLRALGIEPFPAAEFPVTHTAEEVKEAVQGRDWRKGSSPQVNLLAGRMMSVRVMGKASFAVLRDHTGDQQIYVSRDEISPGEDKTLYDEVWKHLLHLGDFIGVKGFVFKTRTGEITVHVKELTVLAKALRPLPVVKTDDEGNVHDAFTDPEQRYRMRYVDLIVNPGVKETFLKRTRIFDAMRAAFQDAGYLEVDTPGAASHPRWCCGASVRDAPQRAGRAVLPAHRQRALPEAPDRGRLRRRVRVQPQLPERGHGPHPQPGVHGDGTLRGLQGLPLDDGLHRGGVHARWPPRPMARPPPQFQGKTIDFGAPFKRITMCGSDPGEDRRGCAGNG